MDTCLLIHSYYFGAVFSFAVEKFTINRVNKSGAVFDATKLK
jgi:hypothetical protein